MKTKLLYRGSENSKFKKLKLKKEDEVVCISGKDKGKKGKILAFDKARDRIFVSGVNKRKKYIRPTQENPQGGVVEIESSIHISNVQLFDSKKKKGIRVGYSLNSGKKVRITRPDKREI